MKYISIILVLFFGLVQGCDKENIILEPEDQKGNIQINIIWPEKAFSEKLSNTERETVDTITAYVYSGIKEITHKELNHVGNYGEAEIEISVGENYRIEVVATEMLFEQVLYVGYKENVDVLENKTATIEITMSDFAPMLYPTEANNDSVVITWSSIPLADSYLLLENISNDFIDEDNLELLSSAKTVYAGNDTTTTLLGKDTGVYFYTIFALTTYDDNNYTGGYDPGWNIYLRIKYGAISNIISTSVGIVGTIKIRTPWPDQ